MFDSFANILSYIEQLDELARTAMSGIKYLQQIDFSHLYSTSILIL